MFGVWFQKLCCAWHGGRGEAPDRLQGTLLSLISGSAVVCLPIGELAAVFALHDTVPASGGATGVVATKGSLGSLGQAQDGRQLRVLLCDVESRCCTLKGFAFQRVGDQTRRLGCHKRRPGVEVVVTSHLEKVPSA